MTFAFTPQTFFAGFAVALALMLLTMAAFTLKMWGDDFHPERPLFLRMLIPLLKVIGIIVGIILLFFLLGNLILWLGVGI